MKLRNLIDLAAVLVIYGFYLGILYLGPVPAFLGTDLTMESTRDAHLLNPMIVTFQNSAVTLVAVSFLCFLAWYFIAEFLIRPNAPVSHWRITWFLLLVVILITAAVEVYLTATAMDDKYYSLDDVAIFYFLTSTFFYYISSIFFSPPNAKYIIWPSKVVRR